MPFPSNTTLLDDFNRTDAANLGSDWTNDAAGGGGGFQVISNRAATQGAAGNQSAYRSLATFAADCEFHVEVAVKGGTGYYGMGLRLTTPGAGTADGYEIDINELGGTDGLEMYRLDNGAYTKLGATVSQEWTAGDLLGVEAIGSALKAYRYDGATWTELMSRTDATYASAGYPYLFGDGATIRFDTLRGGAVVVGGVGLATRRSLLGVGV